SIYDGSAGDPFFNPPFHQDSPHLKGADNQTFHGLYHNDLRVDRSTVAVYSKFLLVHGQTPTFRPCGGASTPVAAAPAAYPRLPGMQAPTTTQVLAAYAAAHVA